MTVFAKRLGRFVETTIDDETVIMDLESGDFLAVGGTGLEIWRRIDGTRDTAAIAAELSAEYDADLAAVRSDVDRFVEELRAAQLVEPVATANRA